MVFLCFSWSLFLVTSVLSSEPSRGLDLLLEASARIDLPNPPQPKRMRTDNSTTYPPVLRLSMSPINFSRAHQGYREAPVAYRFTRYHRDHFLPMGQSVEEFSSTLQFFESRIPEEIRVAALRRFSNIGGRPTAELEIASITPVLRSNNFTDSTIVVKYLEYLISFLYMNIDVHVELVRINRLEISTDATSVARRFREAGLPNYITSEHVFEWYRCVFQSDRLVTSDLIVREDDLEYSLVNLPPRTWTTCFIRPRLERLISTHTEQYNE